MTNQPKIKDYEVVVSKDLEKVKKEVKKFIRRGWQPYYGMKCTKGKLSLSPMYIQPMVLREKPKDHE